MCFWHIDIFMRVIMLFLEISELHVVVLDIHVHSIV